MLRVAWTVALAVGLAAIGWVCAWADEAAVAQTVVDAAPESDITSAPESEVDSTSQLNSDLEVDSPRESEAGATAAESRPVVAGIWTSAGELEQRPMIGPSWETMYRGATQDTAHPDVSDPNDRTNVRVLAAAIVFARTGDDQFRGKVTSSLDALVAEGRPRGRTLAWGRNVGAFVLAADLVGYRTPEFESWLHNVAEVWPGDDRRTLRETFEQRPNNWGFHAFSTLCAIYRYRNDEPSLRTVRDHWIRGVTVSNPLYRFGRDMSWHADPMLPLVINAKDTVRAGFVVDGLFPDEMRRGGPFQDPPAHTGYPWEAMQGLVMAARILERAGMPIWDAGDRALYRAASALQDRLGGVWRARGDDRWLLPFLDHAYGSNWSIGLDVWGHGKNAGWAYVLELQPPSRRPLSQTP